MKQLNRPAFVVLAAILCAGCGYPETATAPPTPGAAEAVHASIVVTDDTFDQVVMQSDKPVLVDFWATWCGPCLAMAPAVEAVAQEFDGRASVAKLDVDAAEQTAARFKIESLPTLILFKDGKEVDRMIGAGTQDEITSLLAKAL